MFQIQATDHNEFQIVFHLISEEEDIVQFEIHGN
jgi:hypothetical protein